MATFNNYDLTDIHRSSQGVYDLSDRLIPRMADAFEVDLPFTPSEESLREFIHIIGPAKTLQDNIAGVQERLGTDASALNLAIGWVDESELFKPVSRSFSDPYRSLPEHGNLGTTFFNTGVARWTLRRAQLLIDMRTQGYDLGQTIIMSGQQPMAAGQHESVVAVMDELGIEPNEKGERFITEAVYAKHYVRPLLAKAGIQADITEVDSRSGDDVFAHGIRQYTDILGGGVTAIANAGAAAVQVAGQFRELARRISKGFNDDGIVPSIYMVSDLFPLARNEAEVKSTATHQNPFTALGQIARSALYLHLASTDFKK